jgi:LacI family transcriptional regulator
MKTSRPITISDIVAATGLSRATIDRVINNRSGVHPRTEAHVRRVLSELQNERSPTAETKLDSAKGLKFGLIVQAGQAFTHSLLTEVQKFPDPAFAGFASRSDDETADLIRTVGHDRNGIAVVAKNTEPIRSAIQGVRSTGKPVVALVSDLNANSRSAYVGIDNRSAGQIAGLIIGRCLERTANAKVAVIVGNFSYRCHEDREIGFRSLLRQRFPPVEIVEVIKGDDSREATYEAASRFLKNRQDIAGIYNVAGGNQGLARAVQECGFSQHLLYITHELNEVTEPLLRSGVVDFLITQSLETLVRLSQQCLIELSLGTETVHDTNYLPVHIVSEFNLPAHSVPDTASVDGSLPW